MIKFGVLAAIGLVAFATAASAADLKMPVKALPPPPPPFSWNGFYIGGEFGGAWANGSVTDSLFGLSAGTSHDGWLAGGVVGYNYQAPATSCSASKVTSTGRR